MSYAATEFQRGYQQGRAAHQIEEERRAAIFRATPTNDPKLLAMVKVRCLRPFYVGGKALEVGEVVSVEKFVAVDMIALKKAESADATK